MGIIEWWEQHPRTRRNIVVVFVLDTVLLLAALFGASYLSAWWSALTSTLPNLYHAMLSQLIAVIFGLPADTGAGGSSLLLSAQYLSLLTFHVCVAFLVGWLLRKRENTMAWRIANYALLFFLLLVLHLIGTFFTYWSY